MLITSIHLSFMQNAIPAMNSINHTPFLKLNYPLFQQIDLLHVIMK